VHSDGFPTAPWTRWIGALIAALALWLAPATPAHADEATNQAKALFKKASKAYTVGRFDDALALYEKAYEAKPLPEFLFNIGQCHFNLQHYDRAVFFYESYLRERPNARNKDLVETQLEEARTQLAKLRADEAARLEAEKAEAERMRAEAERKRAEAEQGRAAHEATAGAEQRALAEEQRRIAEEERKRAEAEAAAAEAESVDEWVIWTGVGVTTAVVLAAATGTTLAVFGLMQQPEVVKPAGSLGTIDARGGAL
jgi:tetratricopeptide (TPR) repeat protein